MALDAKQLRSPGRAQEERRKAHQKTTKRRAKKGRSSSNSSSSVSEAPPPKATKKVVPTPVITTISQDAMDLVTQAPENDRQDILMACRKYSLTRTVDLAYAYDTHEWEELAANGEVTAAILGVHLAALRKAERQNKLDAEFVGDSTGPELRAIHIPAPPLPQTEPTELASQPLSCMASSKIMCVQRREDSAAWNKAGDLLSVLNEVGHASTLFKKIVSMPTRLRDEFVVTARENLADFDARGLASALRAWKSWREWCAERGRTTPNLTPR